MNYSKLFASCLFATVFAFAQFPWETQSENASTPSSSEASAPSPVATPAPAPSRPAEADPAPEEKAIFDNLRGHAYNPYSTQGAASTVMDIVTLPSDIYGQKFFYVSPTDFLGYTAFGMGGGSVLLGLDNSQTGNLAALILGYATPIFGVALNYSVSKTWESNSDTDVSSRTTYPGDNIELYFSMPLSFATLYANASWLTYDESFSTESNGNEIKADYSTIEAIVGLNGKSASLNYDGYLDIVRTGGSRVSNGDKTVDDNTYTGFALGFDLGYAVLQSPTARVILGLNNAIGMLFFDKTGGSEGYNIIGLIVSPNILAELFLSNNWLAFAGAAHSLSLIAGDEDRNNDTSLLTITHSPGTNAFMGIRYQKTNWAFEAQVAANVFDNPFGGFNGNSIFAGFGGFIYF